MERLIKKYQEAFKCLDDWVITYDDTTDKELMVEIDRKKREATIFTFYPICKGEVANPEQYIKHEMLHIAFASAKENDEKEEEFIIDLSKYLKI